MNEKQLGELILQSLEHEKGGVAVYEAALECAVNDDLRSEWEKYLDQTRSHVEILQSVCAAFELDATRLPAGESVARTVGGGARRGHENCEGEAVIRRPPRSSPARPFLVGRDEGSSRLGTAWKGAEKLKGDRGKLLKAACDQVEDQEEETVFTRKCRCRELWFQSLGLPADYRLPRKRIMSRRQSAPPAPSRRAKDRVDTVDAAGYEGAAQGRHRAAPAPRW